MYFKEIRVLRCGLCLFGEEKGPVACFCEGGNETSGPIQDEEFLYHFNYF